MRSHRFTLVGLLVLGIAGAPGMARGPAAAQLGAGEWATDLEQALATAKAGQRLTLICFNMDGEEHNERALQMYRSDEFRKATENVVRVLCSADEHSAGDAPCPRFAGCTCREHIACEKQARRRLFGGLRDNMAAQHLLLYPDGLVAWHAIYEVTPADLFKAIAGSEKLKSQTLDQRLRGQRTQLALLGSKAAKGSPTAYMQVQAMLMQTPVPHFCAALQALGKGVAERVLRDLDSHGRDLALTLLEAAAAHPTKTLRDLADRLAADVRAHPREEAPAEAPAPVPAGPVPLAAPLAVLGPADDFARVQWAGPAQSLADCRDRVTVIWFFTLDMPALASALATMNEFAAINRDRGIETVGLVAAVRPTAAVEKLATIGCRFPVGAYVSTAGHGPCGVERLPAWVVLDPETNMVYCSPQDGSSFEWNAGQTLALQMVASPCYSARIKPPSAGK